MTDAAEHPVSDIRWTETLRSFAHPRVITMLFFGFSAGLPLMLIFSSLSLWLREAGIERSVVTLFSWAALGYSFKFIWAPLVDSLPVPGLTHKLGRRRSWILLAQLMVVLSISLMALQDPSSGGSSLTYMAVAAVLLGFSSATQDIVIDAYRIESAEIKLQALMSSTYIAGYRIGMLVAGAGALYLASWFGSTSGEYLYTAWKFTYFAMAAFMLIGIVTTLLIPEPADHSGRAHQDGENAGGNQMDEKLHVLALFICCVIAFIFTYRISSDLASRSSAALQSILHNRAIAGIVVEFARLVTGALVAAGVAMSLVRLNIVKGDGMNTLYLKPVQDFFQRYGLYSAILLLALVGLYRISDIVLGVIANVFYQDIGYSKIEIATVSKVFGLIMTLLGGFLGGVLAIRFGVIRILLLGAILSAFTNLLFLLLARIGYDMNWLYIVIGADNLSAGIATASFVAFLSALTNIKFTAMQFAIFTSVMTLIPKMLGGYSGAMVDTLGYSQFFIITTLLGIPVILLILFLSRDSRFS